MLPIYPSIGISTVSTDSRTKAESVLGTPQRARSTPCAIDTFRASPFRQHPPRQHQQQQPGRGYHDEAEHRHPRQQHQSERALVPRHRQQPRGAAATALSASALPGFSFGGLQLDRLFDGVNRMMADVGGQMRSAQEASRREDFNGHAYCHSTVYAYSSNGSSGDEPRIYQAVSETRAGPGGVRETRKALKDSRIREEKVAVGRHIGSRGHTVERRRNTRTGDQQEDHHYDGIDEDEGHQFDREWDSRAAGIADSFGGGGGLGRSRQHRLADGRGGGGQRRERPAITDGKHWL